MSHERPSNESEIRINPFMPFYFNPERMSFVIGFSDSQAVFEIDEMKDIWEMTTGIYDLETDENPLSPETLVSIPFGPLVQMGSSRRILQEISRNSTQKEQFTKKVRKVMRDVYVQAAPKVAIYRERKEGNMWPFQLSISENGKFTARTFGECACLGSSEPQTYVTLPTWKYSSDDLSFPVELGLHNADNSPQRLSLYAGVGTIGWLTKQIAENRL